MNEERSGPGDIPTSERIRDIGSAMLSSGAQKASGDEARDQSGAAYRLSEAEVAALTAEWPKTPKHAVEQM